MVVLLRGSGVPIILRPLGNTWTFQGFAHIHPVVEVIEDEFKNQSFGIYEYWWKRQDLVDREFNIV